MNLLDWALITLSVFFAVLLFIQKSKNTFNAGIAKKIYALREEMTQISREKSLLESTLENMMDGLLITDKKGRILFYNKAFTDFFHLKEKVKNTLFLESFRNHEIYNLIIKAGKTEKTEEAIINFNLDKSEYFFMVRCMPSGPEKIITVLHDISELKRLENIRRDFVTNVSHELKTPLTSILGYAETLENGAITDTQAAKKFISKIQTNAIQLKNLVEDILELSRIESGTVTLAFEEINLEKMTDNIFAQIKPLAQNKEIRLHKDISIQSKTIVSDNYALYHILSNLTDNAIKYTPPQGTITLSAKPDPDHKSIILAVEDTGFGIPEKDLERIFERFYRVDKGRSRDMGGTGLGLAIVKHLVASLEGVITVESKTGKGSRFTVTLPSPSFPLPLRERD